MGYPAYTTPPTTTEEKTTPITEEAIPSKVEEPPTFSPE